jgi:hypothetical protein
VDPVDPEHCMLNYFLLVGMPKSSEVPPEEYMLEENEERSMIEPKSYDNPKLKDLIK